MILSVLRQGWFVWCNLFYHSTEESLSQGCCTSDNSTLKHLNRTNKAKKKHQAQSRVCAFLLPHSTSTNKRWGEKHANWLNIVPSSLLLSHFLQGFQNYVQKLESFINFYWNVKRTLIQVQNHSTSICIYRHIYSSYSAHIL